MGDGNGVDIHTDGACLGNPGPGGYGLILLYRGRRKELSGGFRLTTNNRMEIMASIVGLEEVKQGYEITVHSDSRYLVDAMTKGWAKRWQALGWMRNRKDRAENADLWERLLALCDNRTVLFSWVPGHAGHPENERCDALAVAAAKGKDLSVDSGYEQRLRPTVPEQESRDGTNGHPKLRS